MSIEAKQYLDPEAVRAAVACYNSIRTTLEDDGWTASEDTNLKTYWWHHDDHGGTFSIEAAHGQWRLDVEARKHQRDLLRDRLYVEAVEDQKLKPALETIGDIPDTVAGRAFRKAMNGRQYGWDALTQAWGWFQTGFKEGWREHERK
jgi:hypothetical protein